MGRKGDYGMSGEEVFRALDIAIEQLSKTGESYDNLIAFSHMQMLHIHSRALAAHCECLGMNAENCIAAIGDAAPPYPGHSFFEVMKRWGLMDEEGEIII